MISDDARAKVASRLARVRDRIAAAEIDAGRPAGSVRLLLATKTVPVELVRAALDADNLARTALDARPGTRGPSSPVILGENRVQELVAKAPHLADLSPELHLIGPLQSNKVAAASRWASCIESVDTLGLAVRLADRALGSGRVLEVYVQVNVSGEPTKHGVAPQQAVELAVQVAALGGLRLRGLMTVGANTPEQSAVRAGYALLRELGERIVRSGSDGTAGATGLSMGMSRDLELAIAEGATVVRTGTAVFGTRPP
ncbi:MAG TPA: YggS family pyridoxal phosphate-dependent enzyme [Cellulomonas sp.]|uniref:YggS family pyridoxal phosphate-dependent enzyme n=1 Tax=Cellulomonas sp. TaxID=40001 RepID=UPI002E36941A|nr:YggS family pyridoxal phosphate-dependent enzyme [Cellulomonas sp.]HEX5332348.1 YggS family pyridoxal phosphate-dependent enzyme [Cellulomonas sp.]